MISNIELKNALQRYLKKNAPYSIEELARLDSVSIRGIKNINPEEISLLKGMEFLDFVCGEVESISFVESMPELYSINFSCVDIRSLEGLGTCQNLNTFTIGGALVEDVSSLLNQPSLEKVRLQGLPLSEKSYFEVLPKLKELCESRYEYASVYGPFEDNWRICRALCERGIRAVIQRLHVGYAPFVVDNVHAPGFGFHPMADLYSYDITHDQIWEILEQPDLDTRSFMEACKAVS